MHAEAGPSGGRRATFAVSGSSMANPPPAGMPSSGRRRRLVGPREQLREPQPVGGDEDASHVTPFLRELDGKGAEDDVARATSAVATAASTAERTSTSVGGPAGGGSVQAMIPAAKLPRFTATISTRNSPAQRGSGSARSRAPIRP